MVDYPASTGFPALNETSDFPEAAGRDALLDAALSPLLMAASGWIARNLLSDNAATSLITNLASSQLFDPVCRRLRTALVRRIKGEDGSLPRNHDVERSVRSAQLAAAKLLVATFAERSLRRNQPSNQSFGASALVWIEGQEDKLSSLTVADATLQRVIGSLSAQMVPGDAHLVAAGHDAAEATLEELAAGAGGSPPEAFVTLFLTGGSGCPCWLDAFGAFLAEEIKSNPRFQSIVTSAGLAELGAGVRRLEDFFAEQAPVWTALRQQTDRLLSGLERVESKVDAVGADIHDIGRAVHTLGAMGVETNSLLRRLANDADVGMGAPYLSSLPAKLDFMRASVSQQHLAKIGESRSAWLQRFDFEAIAQAWELEVRTDNAAIIGDLVARKLSGERAVKRTELLALAEQTTLITSGHEPSKAAWLLSAECRFETFVEALVNSGWANPGQAVAGRLRSRHLLLELFRPFGLRLGGLRMGDDATMASAQVGTLRGMRSPRADDYVAIQPIALQSPVSLVLEGLDQPRGLLLLEIGPASGGIHPVTSLAPSTLSPDSWIKPDAVLPTGPVNGLVRFIADEPIGRYDWLAILTKTPLALAWRFDTPEFHQLSAADLDWLIAALETEASDPERARHLEVRHHPFVVS